MAVIDKSQTWTELEKHFARVIDGCGTKIDPGIMNAVIAFNAIGVNTTASCEGHLDWGNAYPWIRSGVTGVDDLENELRQALKAYQNAASDDRVKLCDEYYAIATRVQKLHVQEELKLTKYLNAFYKQHEMDYDKHLVIERTISGECILQSHGANLQEIRDPSERAAKLKEYQNEMQTFAEFLKRQYFGEKTEYTTSEAADVLGVEQQTIKRNILRGNLVAEKHGRDWIIKAAEFEKFKNTPRRSGRPSRATATLPANFEKA